jgi:putative two-component system response regulator
MAQETPRRPVVLCVDDAEELLALMAKALRTDYLVLTASDPGTALDLAAGQPRPDLILLDVEMPGANGFEVLRVLKSEGATAGIPVVFLTGTEKPEYEVEALDLGAVDYIRKPVSAAVLKAHVRKRLALSARRQELERLVRERTAQVENTRLQLIRRLSRAMEYHESSSAGNRVMRLAQYAKLMAQAAGASASMCEAVMTAAPLHDIGKLGVPAEVLRKSGKLSAPDWERVKRHPRLGAEIIGEHDDPLLKLARQMALHHHEHWDGTGYPDGMKGAGIPWVGRLMAIVDTFEAMTTTQFYRAPLNVLDAAAEIVDGAGKRYDPKLVEAFKKALPHLRKVRETYADELGDMINLDFAAPRAASAKAAAPQRRAAPRPVKATK